MRRGREADRAVGSRALRSRRDRHRAVAGDGSADPHVRALDGVVERMASARRLKYQSAQLFECAVERQLLRVVELGRHRGQVLVLHDGGVELPVVSDLGVVRLRAGLLAACARDGVEVRIAERRRTELIEDPELELVLVQRGAGHSRAAGHCRQQEHRRERAFHLVPHRHDGRKPELVTTRNRMFHGCV